MNATTKNIIIALTVPVVLSGAYFGIKYYIKVKNTPNRKVFDEIVNNFNNGGADIFENYTPEKMDELFILFQKNIKLKEAEKIIEISKKKENSWTDEEKLEFKDFASKLNLLNSK